MIKLAIIGTSGRYHLDEKKLSNEHMEWMVDNVLCYIESVLCDIPENVILVSGGSAWADHAAVQLYLRGTFAGLELYLPTNFDLENNCYVNTRQGKLLNLLHTKCKNKIGIDVFSELACVIQDSNCKIFIKNGFFSRNSLIAKESDHLIAFTFYDKDAPIGGGTYDTWKKTKHDNKIHISLEWM